MALAVGVHAHVQIIFSTRRAVNVTCMQPAASGVQEKRLRCNVYAQQPCCAVNTPDRIQVLLHKSQHTMRANSVQTAVQATVLLLVVLLLLLADHSNLVAA
jgi:hypothetical protein